MKLLTSPDGGTVLAFGHSPARMVRFSAGPLFLTLSSLPTPSACVCNDSLPQCASSGPYIIILASPCGPPTQDHLFQRPSILFPWPPQLNWAPLPGTDSSDGGGKLSQVLAAFCKAEGKRHHVLQTFVLLCPPRLPKDICMRRFGHGTVCNFLYVLIESTCR